MEHLRFLKSRFARGQIFTIDALLALVFCSIFILVFSLAENKNLETNLNLLKMQKINDLLITSQMLRIDNINVLEQNYLLLLPNTCGYIKINNARKEINCANSKKTNLLSNSIKYINNSKHIVYIEIGVY